MTTIATTPTISDLISTVDLRQGFSPATIRAVRAGSQPLKGASDTDLETLRSSLVKALESSTPYFDSKAGEEIILGWVRILSEVSKLRATKSLQLVLADSSGPPLASIDITPPDTARRLINVIDGGSSSQAQRKLAEIPTPTHPVFLVSLLAFHDRQASRGARWNDTAERIRAETLDLITNVDQDILTEMLVRHSRGILTTSESGVMIGALGALASKAPQVLRLVAEGHATLIDSLCSHSDVIVSGTGHAVRKVLQNS
jgi:hypothetical protein